MSTENVAKDTRIRKALARSLNREPDALADDVVLIDLVAESFALVETVINLQEELNFRLVQDDLRDVKTVGDLVRVCADRLPHP